jgi:assimilatory nitrate reductase catalytic subunit
MGVNQSHQGVATAQAIINLALLTGNIGRPGTGANSITGQCNAMGSRLFSNTTNLLGGHDFSNPGHRAKVARVLEIPEERIPTSPGWAYDQIIAGIEAGRIRGLWVVATNPAHSWIDRSRLREILGRLDYLVVQDMYHSTDTAQLADLLLPAAGWGEKEGTFINSERRIGLIKKVRRAPGQALTDFNIFRLVAHYYGCGSLFSRWESPEAVFQILKQLSSGTPCDFTGIAGYHTLDETSGPIRQRHLTPLASDGSSPTDDSSISTGKLDFSSENLESCRSLRIPSFRSCS